MRSGGRAHALEAVEDQVERELDLELAALPERNDERKARPGG